MGFEIESLKGVAGGWRVAVKSCDKCSSASAVLFCQVDSACLCLDCDAKIHGGGANKRHQRAWLCEVCEQAPAAFFCKADAATLCVTCDRDIHNANPLARRHDRTPVEPFVDSATSAVKSCPFGLLAPASNVGDQLEEHEMSSNWLSPNTNLSSKFNLEEYDMKSADLFSTEIDPFADLEYPSSLHQLYSTAMDSVVPAQTTNKAPDPVFPMMSNENCLDIDFCRSKITAFSYPPQSISQSVSSSSSLEVGLVPDGNFSDGSYSFGRADPSAPISSHPTSQASQLSGGIDREARVLRYREKRKNRKFEKTIRYASRKAYAESRPRIKGRFAKRTEMESEVEDGIFGSDTAVAAAFLADSYYGVVPTF